METLLTICACAARWFPLQERRLLKWEEVRRQNYFKTRLQDCHGRFKRIVGSFSVAIQDANWLTQIERKMNILLNPPGIVAVSNKADMQLLKMFPTTEDTAVDKVGPVVFLCHILIGDSDAWKQIIEQNLANLQKIWGTEFTEANRLLIVISHLNTEVCDINTSDIENCVRNFLIRDEKITSLRVIIGYNEELVPDEISLCLEDAIMAVFDDIYKYVGRFVPSVYVPYQCTEDAANSRTKAGGSAVANKVAASKGDNYASDSVIEKSKSVQAGSSESPQECTSQPAQLDVSCDEKNCIETAIIQTLSNDNRVLIIRDKQSFQNQTIVQIASTSIAVRLRCGLAQIYATRYRLIVWICNQVFVDLKFSDRVFKALSSDTKSIIEASLQEQDKHEQSISSKLLISLTNDLVPVLNVVKNTLARAGEIVGVMKRLQYEVRGYYSQSKTSSHKLPPLKSLSQAFSEDIMSIPHITGIGAVFGECEVHVSSDLSDLKGVKKDIDAVARKHMYGYPIKIRQVRLVTYTFWL